MARIRVLAENPPPPRGYVEDQLRELRDYITRLKDELEFLLTHLGDDNLDSALREHIRNLDGKQDALTFDTAPTVGSTNPVTSGGIAAAVAAVMAPNAVVPNDLNDITANGFYTWAANQSKTNAPRTGPGFLLHLTQSGNRQVQTAWMSGNAMIYYRFKESGTWGAWQMLNVTA